MQSTLRIHAKQLYIVGRVERVRNVRIVRVMKQRNSHAWDDADGMNWGNLFERRDDAGAGIRCVQYDANDCYTYVLVPQLELWLKQQRYI